MRRQTALASTARACTTHRRCASPSTRRARPPGSVPSPSKSSVSSSPSSVLTTNWCRRCAQTITFRASTPTLDSAPVLGPELPTRSQPH
ncbi:hypothetical protein LEMLEM_LOCUS2160 [Lemmus lemmus]